jgi:hypothetical protein
LATLPPTVEAPVADGVFTSDGATGRSFGATVEVVVVGTTGFFFDFAARGTVVVAMGFCGSDGATVVVVVVVTAATFS